ncbi:hypothetical protein LG296_06915 [Ureibacillus chungkukjangi]|uniref:hypothetical protein n=1 Tax=Ureibacillus chungkukjangi TaxID=1202712 RepID=UPI00384E6A72
MAYIGELKATFEEASKKVAFIGGMKATFEGASKKSGIHKKDESHFQKSQQYFWRS